MAHGVWRIGGKPCWCWLGPTLATCFQESVCGRQQSAAARCDHCCCCCSDSLKISPPILSSSITWCSAEAAIKGAHFNQAFESSLFYLIISSFLVSEPLKVSPKHCESDSLQSPNKQLGFKPPAKQPHQPLLLHQVARCLSVPN